MSVTEQASRPEEPKELAPETAGMKAKALLHVGMRSGFIISVIAILVSLFIGALFIWMSGASVADAYSRLLRGAFYNPGRDDFARQIKPLTETLRNSVPLILAGLGLGLGFRAGLFNIGGQGQIVLGAIGAAYIGFSLNLPFPVHLLLAIVVAMIFGGIWGGTAGFLKARTGANEVIVTIMLNAISGFLLLYVLGRKTFQIPGSTELKSKSVSEAARLPHLLPAPFNLHAGFIVAIIATIFVWWVLERSTFGFELRSVGANPHASRVAGMSTGKVTTLTMALSAALCGAAGANEVLGTFGALTPAVAGTIGFDAITVALLGRNKPVGIFFAGLLFGAFKAGAPLMQGANVPVDIILILQAVIVLLIAAPALIRWIFRLPKPDGVSYREYITLQREGKR